MLRRVKLGKANIILIKGTATMKKLFDTRSTGLAKRTPQKCRSNFFHRSHSCSAFASVLHREEQDLTF